MRFVGTRIFAGLLATGWLLSHQSVALADKRVALIVGNSDYKNVTKLANPVNDANAIAALFKKVGFEVVDSRRNLSITDLRRTIRDFGETARDADVAVVYYAGHGIEVDGTNYLIPVDAMLERDLDVEDETVSLDRFLRVLEPVKRLRLVILDACRDNPFSKTMKRTLNTRSIGRGLAKVDVVGTDTLVAFAAKAGSTASDGAGGNSPFATALINNIASPGVDLRIAFGRVRDDVLKSTSNKQEPFVYGSLGGTIISLVPETKDSAATQAMELRNYELAAQVGTREAWNSFLTVHGTGFYADLARAQLGKLLAADKAEAELSAAKAKAASAEKARLEAEARQQAEAAVAMEKAKADAAIKAKAAADAEKARLEAENAKAAAEKAAAADKGRLEADSRRQAEAAAAAEKAKADAEVKAKAAADAEKARLEAAERAKVAAASAAEKAKAEADAKAKAAADAEKAKLEVAEAAKAAAAEMGKTQVAALSPSQSTAPERALADGGSLVVEIKKELKRVGCYAGRIDEKWSTGDTKGSVVKFGRFAKLDIPSDEPTSDLLDIIRSKIERICPLECGARETERDGRCVVKSCPKGQTVGDSGSCETSGRTVSRPPDRPVPGALKEEPGSGTLPHGATLLIDDGSCGAGRIKQVIGGSNKIGIPRTRTCIARR